MHDILLNMITKNMNWEGVGYCRRSEICGTSTSVLGLLKSFFYYNFF